MHESITASDVVAAIAILAVIVTTRPDVWEGMT